MYKGGGLMKEKQDALNDIWAYLSNNKFSLNRRKVLYTRIIKGIAKGDLGTIQHINRINKAELIYGPYFTLTQLISEFNSYNNETIEDLKYNKYTNFDRVCKKVNELVKKVKMTEEIHYFRNRLNKGPKELELLLKEKDNWVLLTPDKSAFHMHGRDGIFNLKFISKDEGNFEVVYDKDNKLVTNRINMGTYNFANPEDIKGHEKYDLKPYYSWGNTEMCTGDGQLESLKKAINNLTRFSSDLNAKERYEKYYFEMYGNPSDVAHSIKLLENEILMVEKLDPFK